MKGQCKNLICGALGVTVTDATREEITAQEYTTSRTVLKQDFNREIPTLKMYLYFIQIKKSVVHGREQSQVSKVISEHCLGRKVKNMQLLSASVFLMTWSATCNQILFTAKQHPINYCANSFEQL